MQAQQTRVDKIRLPFDFAAAQVGEKATRLYQSYAEEPHPLPIPEAKISTSKIRVVEDAIKPSRCTIGRILVPRGIRHGDDGTQPIAVNRQFQSGKLRVDRDPAPGERVTRIGTDRFIQSMRHVEYANVPTARPPQIDHIQFMRGEHPDRIRTDQEVIGVKV